MTLLEILGYAGGVLVFSTFYLKTMVRLRVVAIASNVVYIAYSALLGLAPILVLLMALGYLGTLWVRRQLRRS